MDEHHHSGLYQFLPITILQNVLYRKDETWGGGHRDILITNLDSPLAKTANGPLDFVGKIADAPWLLDDRYISRVVVFMHARINILKRTPECLLMYKQAKSSHTFVAWINKVSTTLPIVND